MKAVLVIPDNDPNAIGAQGCFYDDGTSAGWNEGWWNCLDWGGQVFDLIINFVLNLLLMVLYIYRVILMMVR